MGYSRSPSARAVVGIASAFLLQALPVTSCLAQGNESFPSKPLRLVVPFAPGGAADVIGRAVADQLQRELGQAVVVVNRDGAGTIVGVNYVAKSPADGYTLLLSGDAATINTASGRTLPYDFLRELTPVSILFSGAQILLVSKDSPFKTLQDMVAYARAHPGKLRYGSSGIGTSIHLAEASFNAAAQIEALHVPYRGVAPAITDLVGGQVDYVIAGSSLATQAIQSGQLRALAITTAKRSEILPDIPTAKEQGVDVETMGWYGLFVPAATPPAVISRLNAATLAALKSPELSERFKSIGGEARGTSPEEAGAFVKAEIRKFSELMRRLNIKLDN
ncbi:MAG: tripartite tricarboxylate transporter substrate binding protein [Pigmentiphaga sp.]|uniref:Bug family tripartite tricarboxylate transporter substrate binding protein n=1 Tax=Pigmentiphaga sp. TaxID=1977564 RepID=UPI0029B487F8|nr:tripartite tricarboxylate transporter substrate binding protein [Pigmentiphaga sp.]MDX3906597.1 tripartite tricarboxylate transporter substrate binding protein [Pigmentiphaga sp.]